jgi:hypothetical protein
MLQIDQGKEIWSRKCTRHQALQYLIQEGKLWRLHGGTAAWAWTKVECVTKVEAKELVAKQHAEGGHWGHDGIKIALTNCIHSPKLDTSIMEAISNCSKCKNFGTPHLHSLLEPIMRRHPFELLVGDYLTLPKAWGYNMLGVYLDTFL